MIRAPGKRLFASLASGPSAPSLLPGDHSDLHALRRFQGGAEERVDREQRDVLADELPQRWEGLALDRRYLYQGGAGLQLARDLFGDLEGAVHRDCDHRDVASLHGLRVSGERCEPVPASRRRLFLGPAGVGPPHRVAPFEEVAHDEGAHPPGGAEDGDPQLSSSPIFRTPAESVS